MIVAPVRQSKGPIFVSITTSQKSLLPEAIDNLDFEEYLHNFGDEVAFTSSASTSSSNNSKRKFQYANALTNISSRMTRYGLKQQVDLSNTQVPIQTTERPPFESFRLMVSPDQFERKVHLGVFTEQHYDKRFQWSEVNIDFISPQQDLIAEAILTGLAVPSTCPESAPGFDVLSSEMPIPVESITSIVHSSKLPKSNNYWTNWKKVDRTQWEFLTWFEQGNSSHIALKKWTKDNRRKDGVDAKTFSNLKCIYNKLTDSAGLI